MHIQVTERRKTGKISDMYRGPFRTLSGRPARKRTAGTAKREKERQIRERAQDGIQEAGTSI
jgi:hypothetical protein